VNLTGYTKKDETYLAWKENREKIELQGRQLLRRVLNSALAELDREFKDAIQRGEILSLDYDKAELRALLRGTADRVLAPAKGSK
jgi:hypothetical protein